MNDLLDLLGSKNEAKEADVYVISALTREDFKDNHEVLAKYFRNNNRDLDRFHIPMLTKEEYEEIAKEFTRTSKFNTANLKYETASAYYLKKARITAVAKALGCSVKKIDTKDYIWDERYYVRYGFIENINYVDEMFRDMEEDYRSADARQVYIKEDPRTSQLNVAMWDSLYNLCTKAIRVRKAMLLSKIDKCLGFLMSVLDYTNGFTQNATANQCATLRSYVEFYTKLLKNKEFAEFLKDNNDVEIFGKDPLTHTDYVDTYRSLCKLLIHGADEDMQYFKPWLAEVEDPYMEELMEIREFNMDDCESLKN